MKTTDLTRIALMLALLVVSAQFSIPIGPIAISLQTLVVLIIGLVLPTKQAVLTTSLYVVIGLIGLPVFAQGMGGPQSVLLPSFGFILSFTPAVWAMSKIRKMKPIAGIHPSIFALIVGNVIIYALGLLYMTFILTFYVGQDLNFGQILSIGMLPFIPGDIIKSIVAMSISKRLNAYLNL